MKIRNISIKVSEEDLLIILKRFLESRNISIKGINIDKSISIKNISHGIIRNINLKVNIIKAFENEIHVEIDRVSFKNLYIPKLIVDIFLKLIFIDIEKRVNKGKIVLVFNLNSYIKNSNVKFFLNKVYLGKGFMNIVVDNVCVEGNKNKLKQYSKGELFLRLTQTTLKLSGEDIMSFIKDFIRTDKVMISGVDVSQAVYLKGMIINSFEIGDISVNIKDLKENLLYIQLKIINSIFPGINIEHIPMRIFVKDILKSFNNLNLDLDISSVRFVSDCIEVKINNLNFDMKKLSSNSNNMFLK